MEQTPERPFRTLWIGVVLIVIILSIGFWQTSMKPAPLPVLGQVGDFSLTNQLGQAVSLADLHGQVWLADIIFTRCPGPCARMSRQLAAVQADLPRDSEARFVSLTTDPDFDSPPVLAKYGERFGADDRRWQFLTGTKLQIASLAVDSLKLTTLEKPVADRTSEDDLFIHSTIFVLVDKQARLRGIFETGGEGVEWTNVQPTILSAIKQLEREP